MSTRHKSFFNSIKAYILYMVVFGLIVGLSIGAITLKSAKKKASADMTDTLNYIKNQCMIYTRYNYSSTTKSLMRAIENAQQLSRDISGEFAGLAPNNLSRYVQELRLSGVIICDRQGKVITEYNNDALGSKGLEKYIFKESVLDVADNAMKTYVTRIDMTDGSYVDLASYGLPGTDYVVVGYYHTSAYYASKYNLTIQNLLAGYSMDDDGTIAIADGNMIIASNDENLIDTAVEDNYILNSIKNNTVTGMKHIRIGTERYYGKMDKSREYYIYVYIPYSYIHQTISKNIMHAFLIYILIITVVYVIKRNSEKANETKRAAMEADYRDQLIEAARKAESANKAKTEFLQRMSHDIRTPINGIRGMVEIGDHYSDDLQKQTECRAKIKESSGYLLELVNEILDMGKLEAGQIELESRPFELHKLLTETVNVIYKQAQERGIEIIPVHDNIKYNRLIGSPVHLKRMLMNIMGNAVKYNIDNGKVYLKCSEISSDSDTIKIEFICSDTGIGMSRQFQEHIYEPFSQEKNDARSSYGGSGLGIPIAKSIVDKMGGTLEFVSEQGEGTTFTAIIPFKIDKSLPAKNSSDTQEKISIKGINVLIAEDNELNMEISTFVLENEGANVQKALNGKEAVEIFAMSKPGDIDVILMDIMMPEMDGFEASKAIRSMDRPDAATVVIIAMTANAFTDDRQKAFEAGMDEHLSKPLEPAAIVNAIYKHVLVNRCHN